MTHHRIILFRIRETAAHIRALDTMPTFLGPMPAFVEPTRQPKLCKTHAILSSFRRTVLAPHEPTLVAIPNTVAILSIAPGFAGVALEGHFFLVILVVFIDLRWFRLLHGIYVW